MGTSAFANNVTSSPGMASATRKINALQCLRAVAAGMVVVSHVDLSQEFTFPPADWMALGVDIFFVISGYIMTTLVADAGSGWRAAGNFMMRRCIRLLPLYWLVTTIPLLHALIVNHRQLPLASILSNYLLFPDVFSGPGVTPPLTVVGWTLIYEFYFYVLVSLGIALGLGRRGTLMLVAALLFSAGLVDHAGLGGPALHYYADPITVEFVLGGLLALSLPRIERMPWAGLMAWSAVLGGGVVVMATWQGQRLHGQPAWIIASVLIVGGFLLMETRMDWRRYRLLIHGGDISYSLYLVHAVLVMDLRAIFIPRIGPPDFSPKIYGAIFVLIAITASVATANFIYTHFERPSREVLIGYFYGAPAKTTYNRGMFIAIVVGVALGSVLFLGLHPLFGPLKG